VLFDPLPQHARRRPNRFLLAQAGFHRRGRVVHHVHQACLPGAALIPVMETAVHLHQLPEVRPPLAPSAMLFALPRLLPQSCGEHPPPQRLGVYGEPVFHAQMLRRQRRPEARVFFLHLL
jgi:hypothetical protein